MQSKLEREIQANVTKEAIFIGLFPIRINVTGRKGWPDYGYMYKGRVCFVEYKRPGESPDPLQEYVHRQLKAAGTEVFVVSNEDYGINILTLWKLDVDRQQKSLDELRKGTRRIGGD